jgi:hypothetical protein
MQMQDKQPQPQPRPPIKMADTPDYIGLYTADLLRMRAQGKSDGEMLSWLRSKRVDANLGEVVAFWQDYDKKQRDQHPQPETTASKGASSPSNGPTPGLAGNPEPNESTSDTEKPKQPTEEKCRPMAGGGLTAEVPMLWDYVLDLVTLRGIGKSDSEILDWLGKTKRLYTCAKEIANALEYFEKCQEEIQEDFEQSMVRELDEERDQPHEENFPPTASGGFTAGIAPSGSTTETAGTIPGAESNPEPKENPGDTEKPKQSAEENCPPDGPCGIAPGRRPHTAIDFDISAIMDDYKVVVARQAAKDKATENLSPERDKITQRMIHTLMIYKISLERREERLMALKIKTEELELKKSKAVAAVSQEEEETNETAATATPAQKKAPKDFDNTALIELMRRVYFKDVDALLASGLVDDLLVSVLNKPKAGGAPGQNYVPPPLGTGLWSKPSPTASPTASSSGIPSAIAQSAAAEAQQATPETPATSDAASHPKPADVMARINAFLVAYAKKEAADSSGLAQPAATEALAPSAQPLPIPEKPVPTIGADPSGKALAATDAAPNNSPISPQPAKPGPAAAGTTPEINPSG